MIKLYQLRNWSNIWSEYIERYSKKGNIILDPFCGRGVGVIESVKNGRKAIGIDLNLIAIFQTKMISKSLDIEKFKEEWGKIKTDLNQHEKESTFFTTKCIKCEKDARLVTVNRDKNIPYTLFYVCTCTKGYQEKTLDKNDINAINNSNKHAITFQYPNNVFPDTEAFDVARKNYGDTYDTLFSKRNCYALSLIFDRINKVDDDSQKDFFRFAFVSMIHLASRILSVRENSDRVGSGSWDA